MPKQLKKPCKMNTTTTQQADTKKTSHLVKKYLLNKYGINCSVRSELYSGGSSFNVSYELGPNEAVINSELKLLQYGYFNSMDDMYEMNETNIPFVVEGYQLKQFKFIFVRQSISNEMRLKLMQFFYSNIKYSGVNVPQTIEEAQKYSFELRDSLGVNSLENHFYRAFQAKNFVPGVTVDTIELKKVEFIEGSNGEIKFTYLFNGKEYNTAETFINEKPAEAAAKPSAVEVVPGTVHIIEYSERAVAVVGDTKPIKDKLKELGGKFNARLSCGPGWIFSKSKVETLTAALV